VATTLDKQGSGNRADQVLQGMSKRRVWQKVACSQDGLRLQIHLGGIFLLLCRGGGGVPPDCAVLSAAKWCGGTVESDTCRHGSLDDEGEAHVDRILG